MKQDINKWINRIWRKILVYRFCISRLCGKATKNDFRPNDESMERKSAKGQKLIWFKYYLSNAAAYLTFKNNTAKLLCTSLSPYLRGIFKQHLLWGGEFKNRRFPSPSAHIINTCVPAWSPLPAEFLACHLPALIHIPLDSHRIVCLHVCLPD